MNEVFHRPHTPYGRDREIARLRAASDAITHPAISSFIFVTDAPGIGKSSLVPAIQDTVAAAGGLLPKGKFGQVERSTPYGALSSAIDDIVSQPLVTGRARLEATRAALVARFLNTARVLVDAFPSLLSLLGEHPPAVSLEASESQARLQNVLSGFFEMIAADVTRLLFLDDLQWADSFSLSFLETIALGALSGRVLVVLAYREEEVDVAHPFARTMTRVNPSLAARETIILAPFGEVPITALLVDALHSDLKAVASLAQVVLTKSARNPIFVTQFLGTIHGDGLLSFDVSSRMALGPARDRGQGRHCQRGRSHDRSPSRPAARGPYVDFITTASKRRRSRWCRRPIGRRFGSGLPTSSSQTRLDALLAGVPTKSLLDRRIITDPMQKALSNLLESSEPPIYMIRPELFSWTTFHTMLISLEHGHSEASCSAYGIYALHRAAVMGDVDGECRSVISRSN